MDFALVKLSSRVTTTPVPLDDGKLLSYSDGKANLYPIGFGTTEIRNISTRLKEVEVKYVSQSKCKESYGSGITGDEMMPPDSIALLHDTFQNFDRNNQQLL